MVAVFLGMIFWLQIVRFSCSLWYTGGGGGGSGGGAGGGSGIGGGPAISRDDPLLTDISFFAFIEKALQMDGQTYRWTDGRTDPLIEMRGRI